MIRELVTHHDGHGLNESISVRSTDEVGPGGAYHRYEMWIDSDYVGFVQFQYGPRNHPDSLPGATESSVLAILIDRLESFQAGPYACEENRIVLEDLYHALSMVKARADARANRGVLGTYVK